MSEETSVEEANPYNAKKSWDSGEQHARGLNDPNTSLFQTAPKTTEELVVEATQEEPVEQEVDTKYSKVDYKKRYDDLKGHYDTRLVEWKAQQEQLEARIKSNTPKTIPKTPEELATFKEEYSDVYDVVESVAHIKAQEQLEEVRKEIDELRFRETETRVQKAQLLLEKLHPDFHEISETDDFHNWAETQPAVIKGWIYDNSTDASLAARAIDLYKQDKGMFSDTQKTVPKQPKVKQDPAEAVLVKDSVNPTSGEKKIWKSSEIESLSIAQYESNREEIDNAFAEGRISQG